MQLDPIVRDLEGFHDQFVEALIDPENRIYLDTSALMWLLRIGTVARTEFIQWATARSVRVPVWSAHEFHRHIVKCSEIENVRKTVSETQAKYEEFVRLANERADDAICAAKGYLGRSDFIGELEHSLVKLDRMIRVVEPHEAGLRAAIVEIVEFLNTFVMSSNIEPIISRLNRTAAFRASHLMPPGFQDAWKDENPHGDVVIWEEIVADIKAAGLSPGGKRHAILISRDKKTDWVSAARLVRGPRGETSKPQRDIGLDVILAHPLLVHEFKTRTREIGDKFFVSLPGTLAGAVDYHARKTNAPQKVQHWLASCYRPDFVRNGLASSSLGSTPAIVDRTSSPRTSSSVVQSPAGVAREPLATLTVKRLVSLDVRPQVAAYMQASPTQQDSLIQGWLSPEALPPAKLGQLLAELAKAGATGVIERLVAIVEEVSFIMDDQTVGHLILSLAVPAYFDHHGDLLRQPHQKLGLAVLSLASVSKAAPALALLRDLLKRAGAHLPHFPGEDVKRLKWVVGTSEGRSDGPKMIKEIRVADQSAWTHKLPEESNHTLSGLLSREPSSGCTGAELRNLIAGQFLIPLSLLSDTYDKQRFTWPSRAGLVTIDTEAEGGLSLDAEHNEDEGND